MTRRPQPLTERNSVGNGSPATADLVQVQGFLNASVTALGTEMGHRLERMEDRVNEKIEKIHGELKEGQTRQAQACALLMAPYSSLGQAFKVAGWIVAHKGWATAIFGATLTAVLVSAAIIGGLLLPGK